MFGSPAFTVVPAAWLLLAPISTRSDAICSHVPPKQGRQAGGVGALVDAAPRGKRIHAFFSSASTSARV